MAFRMVWWLASLTSNLLQVSSSLTECPIYPALRRLQISAFVNKKHICFLFIYFFKSLLTLDRIYKNSHIFS